MSTRGMWGYVIDGELKATYNHSDSYPSWLGSQLLEFLRKTDVEVLRDEARKLRVVDESSTATPEDIERLSNFSSTAVSTGELTEWYVLLRETQGDPEATFAAGVMIDGSSFALESLFCEWAYVIDLDREKFEVYQGFQKHPPKKGRWKDVDTERKRDSKRIADDYYPIELIAEFDLSDLPAYEEFERQVDPPEDE